jgi:hypothetical protein
MIPSPSEIGAEEIVAGVLCVALTALAIFTM